MKQYIPSGLREYLSGVRASVVGRAVFSYDRRRFIAAYAPRVIHRNTQSQLEGRMTFYAHSIEKGLSHDKVRYGFGGRALTRLAKSMSVYKEKGYPLESKAYMNALSVLKAYIVLHEDAQQDVTHLLSAFSADVLDEARSCKSTLGGVVAIDGSEKKGNRNKNFKDLFTGRWSIREYADSPVDLDLVHEAIEIATKAPSICNRQSGRVQIIADRDTIKKALDIQMGMTGYDLPPVLLAVTTDSSSFVDLTERNQVYIDGGLFAMSLLLSLEYVSLAACSLNAMFPVGRDKKMRHLLGIPSNENIIMFIAVGNFKDAHKAPKSFRYTGEEIVRIK